jgi:hypothetical protein
MALSAICCATGTGGKQATPLVEITQLTGVEALGVPQRQGRPVEYQIEITNPFDYAVTLTSVEVETVGDSGAYRLRRVKHVFARDIGPRAVDTVQFRAWVTPLQLTDRDDASSPVMVRGIARFKSASGVMQSSFATRVQ